MALTENGEHLQCGRGLAISVHHHHTTLSRFREISLPIFPRDKY
jgi:hypothetical protein